MTASGRYKSRLLNFVLERSQKFQSQAAKGFRQVRTGLVWGAQMVLYPLYVAFQAARVVGRQMGAGGASPKANFAAASNAGPAEAADSPLQKVLNVAQRLADQGAIALTAPLPPAPVAEIAQVTEVAEVADIAQVTGASRSSSPSTAQLWETFESQSRELQPREQAIAPIPAKELPTRELASATSSEPTPSLTTYIRGIANQLDNRELILVDNQNRIVHLEAEQQWQLQQQIVQEVAAFAYRRRLYLRRQQQTQHPLPPPSSDRPHLFPVVRWFNQTMGWIQRSPVAQSINLFQEAQLPPAGLLESGGLESGGLESGIEQLLAQLPLPDWTPDWTSEQHQAFALAALEKVDAPLYGLEETYFEQVDPTWLGNIIRSAAAFFGVRFGEEQLGNGVAGAGVGNQRTVENGLEARANLGPAVTVKSSAVLEAENSANGTVSAMAIANPNSSLSQPLSQSVTQSLTQGPLTEVAIAALIAQDQVAQDQAAQAKPAPLTPKPAPQRSAFFKTLFSFRLPFTQRPSPQSLAPQSLAPQPGPAGHLPADSGAKPANLAVTAASPPAVSPGKATTAVTGAAVTGVAVTEAAVGTSESKALPPEDQPNLTRAAGTTPTWKASYIETTAIVTGYIKHPLEWILERLDRILLWIEQSLSRLWHWIQSLFHKRKSPN